MDIVALFTQTIRLRLFIILVNLLPMFSAVMDTVASGPFENPLDLASRLPNTEDVAKTDGTLSPKELLVPSEHFSILGDIVIGLLLCFVLLYNAYKESQISVTYFHCSLIGGFLGLLTTAFSSKIFNSAQQSLLRVVMFTLLPLLPLIYLKVRTILEPTDSQSDSTDRYERCVKRKVVNRSERFIDRISEPVTSVQSEFQSVKNGDFLNPEELKYDVAGGKTSFHGLVFQLKLLMIALYRGIKLYPYLYLATEMTRAEKFDDVVIKYKKRGEKKWNWYFAQAKHKLNATDSLITLKELFYKNDKKGDFYLPKYFTAFCKILGNPCFKKDNIDQIVMCTNASLEDNLRDYYFKRVLEPKSNEFLYFEQTNTYDLNPNLIDQITTKFESQKEKKVSKIKLSKPKETYVNGNETKVLSIDKFLIEIQNEIKHEISIVNGQIKTIENTKESILKSTEMDYVFSKIKNNFILGKISDKLYKDVKEKTISLESAKGDIKIEIDNIITEYEQINNFLNNISLDNLECFLTKIKFICNCPDDDKIDNVISRELGEQFGLINADLFSHSFQHDMVNWFKEFQHGKGSYLCITEGQRMLDLIKDRFISYSAIGLSLIHIEKLKFFRYKNLPDWSNDLISASKSYKTIFILTKSALLSAIKIIQILQKNPETSGKNDSFIFIKSNELPKNIQLVNNTAFKNAEYIKFLVIVFEDHFIEETKDFFLKIIDTLTENSTKKVLIISNRQGLTAYPKTLFKRCQIFRDNNNNFTDLDVTSQERILNLKVHLQNNPLCMNRLMDTETACKLIDTKLLVKLLEHHIITIGKSELPPQLPDYYMERELYREPRENIPVLVDLRNFNSAVILVSGISKEIFTLFLDEKLGLIYKHRNEESNSYCSNKQNPKIQNEIASDSLNILEFNDFPILSNYELCFKAWVENNNIGKENAYTIILTRHVDYGLRSWEIIQNLRKHDCYNDIQDFYFLRYEYDSLNICRSSIPSILVNLRTLESAVIFITDITAEGFKPFINKKRGLIYEKPFKICDTCKESNQKFEDEYSKHIGVLNLDDICMPLKCTYTIILVPQNTSLLNIYQNYIKQEKIKNVYWIVLWKQNEELLLMRPRTFIDEEDIANLEYVSKKICIVANDAGMGKSCLLTSLAHKIKRSYPESWIFRINLNNYVYTESQDNSKLGLRDMCFSETETDKAINFITDMLLSNDDELSRSLFKLSLRKSSSSVNVCPKIVFLFDGFDELSDNAKDNTLILFKALQNCNFALMCITTRTHEQISLYRISNLNTTFLGLLYPSNEQEIQLLSKIWLHKIQCFEIKSFDKAYEKIFHYLKEFSNCGNIEDNNLISTMISLQKKPWYEKCDMKTKLHFLRFDVKKLNFSKLAKKAIDHWETLRKHEYDKYNNSLLRLEMYAEIMFAEKFNLIDMKFTKMCQRSVQIKFEHYYNTFGLPTGDERERNEAYLNGLLENMSFNLYLVDKNSHILKNNHKLKSEDITQLHRVGLLEYDSNGNLAFIHQIYAEYFLAVYIAKHWKHNRI